MRTQKAYCSACDRQVEVVIPKDLPEGSFPSAHDPASCICLEFGESCTGSLCPLFDVPTGQMEENYRRIVQEIRESRKGTGKDGDGVGDAGEAGESGESGDAGEAGGGADRSHDDGAPDYPGEGRGTGEE